MQYKVLVDEWNYERWSVYDAITLNKLDNNVLTFNPYEKKIFSSDIFTVLDNKITFLHSSTRLSKIPATIIINQENKYYYNNGNIFNCIPDDKRLPIFRIEIKDAEEFKDNIYVIIEYTNWSNTFPEGTIIKVLGNVNDLSNFYEYQLYCKSLYSSLQEFNKHVSSKIKQRTTREFVDNIIDKYNLEDRTHEYVFTIDSEKTVDFDDGMSIMHLDEGVTKISIYIANVTLWLFELDLWSSFSNRVSTIYLPDRKRPMLPTILSECMCSLISGQKRIAFCLDVFIKDNIIIDKKYVNCFVCVKKNYAVENNEVENNEDFKLMFSTLTKLYDNYKFSYGRIKNKNDVVSYLMVLMNNYIANEMFNYENGIYRSMKLDSIIKLKRHEYPNDVQTFLNYWHCNYGHYKTFDENIGHNGLNVETYMHVTSPIRRLVDIINITQFQLNTNMIKTNDKWEMFKNKWMNNIEYINTTMRAVRKIQCDCSLIQMYNNDESIKDKEFNGYVFDKLKRNDGLYQYIVYISELKNVSRITLRFDIPNGSIRRFKILMFNDNITTKRKIRLKYNEE
jgi:hypothetical protein